MEQRIEEPSDVAPVGSVSKADRPDFEEERRGDPLQWRRWKGSLQEIARICRLADELVEKAAGPKPEDAFGGSTVTVYLQGKDRTFRELSDFEAGLKEIDLESLRGVMMMTGYWTDKVSIMLHFHRESGAGATVSGKDQFAVSGVEQDLKSALNKGRRWTQVGGLWPGSVARWAPWVAIAGLALIALIDGGTGRGLGIGLLVGALLMLATVLFMEYVEPRLVPPLELLGDSDEQTVSQVWGSRALKAGGLALAAVAGAIANGLTGFLF